MTRRQEIQDKYTQLVSLPLNRSVVLCVLFIGIFIRTHAQNKEIDSLLNALAEYPTIDTQKVRLANSIALKLYGVDPGKTDSVASEALAWAEQLDFLDGQAESWYFKSVSRYVKGDFDGALEWIEKAEELYGKVGNMAGVAKTYSLKGGMYRFKGNYNKSLDYHLRSLKIREQIPGAGDMGKSIMNIGVVYYFEKDYATAVKFFREGIKPSEEEGDYVTLASIYNNLGAAYMEMDSVPVALGYFKKSLEMHEKLGQKLGVIAITRNMGNIHLDYGDPNDGEPHFRKALKIAREIENDYEIGGTAKDLGHGFLKAGKLDSARKYLNMARKLAEKTGAKELALMVTDKFVQVYKAQGDFEQAFNELKGYNELQEELRNGERMGQIEELRVKYETEKKEKENAVLRVSKAESEIAASRNYLIFFLIAGFLLILIIVLLVVNRNKQRTNSLLASQKAEIEKQKDRLEELNREKDGLVSVVAHDLRTPLMRVESMMTILEDQGDLNASQQKSIEMVKRVTQDGSNLIRDLLQVAAAEQINTPPKLVEIELNSFLQELLSGHAKHAQSKDIEIVLASPDEQVIVQSDREDLTRIIDNLVSNALKFSPKSRKVWVNLSQDSTGTRIQIKDEGPGISAADQEKMFHKFQKLSARPTAGEQSTGLGLCIVKALVERLDGQINVNSTPGEGATLEVVL